MDSSQNRCRYWWRVRCRCWCPRPSHVSSRQIGQCEGFPLHLYTFSLHAASLHAMPICGAGPTTTPMASPKSSAFPQWSRSCQPYTPWCRLNQSNITSGVQQQRSLAPRRTSKSSFDEATEALLPGRIASQHHRFQQRPKSLVFRSMESRV
uniref:Uncharacterized protein n=1 Tax=Arundo donax TaxID=35708 RepID=A0A0A8Y4C1_ARUDO